MRTCGTRRTRSSASRSTARTRPSCPRASWSSSSRGASLADPGRDTRALVERLLPSCDTDVASELLVREPLEERVAKALDLFEPRVLALAALRAADSNAERPRKRGLERLKAMRPKLE